MGRGTIETNCTRSPRTCVLLRRLHWFLETGQEDTRNNYNINCQQGLELAFRKILPFPLLLLLVTVAGVLPSIRTLGWVYGATRTLWSHDSRAHCSSADLVPQRSLFESRRLTQNVKQVIVNCKRWALWQLNRFSFCAESDKIHITIMFWNLCRYIFI